MPLSALTCNQTCSSGGSALQYVCACFCVFLCISVKMNEGLDRM